MARSSRRQIRNNARGNAGLKCANLAVNDVWIERVNKPFRAGIERCARLDMPARERHLSEVHRKRCGALCLRSVIGSSGRSKIPSIVLQASSASAKVLNGEPITLTAPVLE